jgi:transposase
MAEIDRKTKRYPTDLTNKEWATVEPYLSLPAKTGRQRQADLREALNTIRYLVRTGRG